MAAKRRKTTKKRVAKRKPVKRVAKRKPVRRPAPKPVHSKDKPTPAVGIIVLLFNGLILPGLGSLMGKKATSGIIQLVLAVIGQLFMGMIIHQQLSVGFGSLTVLGIVGIVLVAVAWVWGLISGIDVIRRSVM